MPERPPITGKGRIIREMATGRLFKIEMANGHCAMAVVPKSGPSAPAGLLFDGGLPIEVTAAFSPYDMSHCRIAEWHRV